MVVNGKHYRTVWMEDASVCLIEQNLLPFEFRIFRADNYRDTCMAISTMIFASKSGFGVGASP